MTTDGLPIFDIPDIIIGDIEEKWLKDREEREKALRAIVTGYEDEFETEEDLRAGGRSKISSATSLSLDELEELIRRYPEVALLIAEAKQAELMEFLHLNADAYIAYMQHQQERLDLLGQIRHLELSGEIETQAEQGEAATREAADIIVEAVEIQTRELQGFLAEPIAWFADRLEDLLAIPATLAFTLFRNFFFEEVEE